MSAIWFVMMGAGTGGLGGMALMLTGGRAGSVGLLLAGAALLATALLMIGVAILTGAARLAWSRTAGRWRRRGR